jgi:hypothetical protein
MGRHRAAIQRDEALLGAGFLQIGGERGDYKHRLQSLAQQDYGGFNENT